MNKHIYSSVFLLIMLACQSQTKTKTAQTVGGHCEGCEAVYEYGDKKLTSIDTLPKFKEASQKLKLEGTVYLKDGKTPAENVILYIYHTNEKGIYEKKGDEKGWAKRHGYIRGWIKTGKDGTYQFYTFKPAPYPNGRAPNHIHATVKEPDKNEYYIEDFLFEDDSLLTSTHKNRLTQRGGSGITMPVKDNGVLVMKRDIILGFNIPGYE